MSHDFTDTEKQALREAYELGQKQAPADEDNRTVESFGYYTDGANYINNIDNGRLERIAYSIHKDDDHFFNSCFEAFQQGWLGHELEFADCL